MTAKIQTGDYVPDGRGGFCRLEGREGLLAEALFRLSCRRGAFPFLPELGSRLYRLPAEKPSARLMAARQYAAQALEGTGLEVADVSLTAEEDAITGVTVLLRLENETIPVEVKL